jgi:hypothetical protein
MRLIVLLLITFICAAALAKITPDRKSCIQALQKNTPASGTRPRLLVQKTTNIDKDGNKKVEIWYEAFRCPAVAD